MASTEDILKELARTVKMAQEAMLYRKDTHEPVIISMHHTDAAKILARVEAQDKEMEQLRKIFADMVGHSDILHEAKTQERRRCLALVVKAHKDALQKGSETMFRWAIQELSGD